MPRRPGTGNFDRPITNGTRTMAYRWIFAALHVLALGIGLGAIWSRSRALRQPLDPPGLARVFAADTWWGVAAAIWLFTGLVRVFSSLDKGQEYYIQNYLFLLKMALFLTIVALEIRPMLALTSWRAAVRRGEVPDTTRAPAYATTSTVQATLIVLSVIAATGMARGFGIM